MPVTLTIIVELLKVHVSISDAKQTKFEVNINTSPLLYKICHSCNNLFEDQFHSVWIR